MGLVDLLTPLDFPFLLLITYIRITASGNHLSPDSPDSPDFMPSEMST